MVAPHTFTAQAQSPDAARPFLVDVRDGTGHSIANASVSSELPRFELRTDERGHLSFTRPTAGDTLLVVVRAVGFTPQRLSLVRGRPAVVLLSPTITRLAETSVVTSRRRPPPRTDIAKADSSSAERMIGYGALTPDQQGDLVAAASALPGVLQVSGDETQTPGYAVLGLTPSENSVLLDGQRFPTPMIPRDVPVAARLATSSTDPARGGFSGAVYDVRTSPGADLATRTVHLTVDAPPLQYSSAEAGSLGARASNVILSAASSGRIRPMWYYNIGAQGGRRSSMQPTLETAAPLALSLAGAAADSITPVRAWLRDNSLAGGASRRASTASAFARADVNTPSGAAMFVSTHLQWSRREGLGLQPLTASSHGARATQGLASILLGGSWYNRTNALTEVRLGILSSTGHVDADTPAREYIAPIGAADELALGHGRLVALGGADTPSEVRRITLLDGSISHVGFSSDNRVEHSVGAGVAVDDGSAQRSYAGNGSLLYRDVAALVSGTPAFLRVSEGDRRVDASTWTASVHAAAAWHPTPELRLSVGARLENTGIDARQRDVADDVMDGIGGRNTVRSVSLLPRLGIVWTVGHPTLSGAGAPTTRDHAVRLSVGRYRAAVPTLALAQAALTASGPERAFLCDVALLGAIRLAMPNASLRSDPACAVVSRPAGAMLADDYTTPVSTRLVAGWTGRLSEGLRGGVEGTLSATANQPSLVDRNLIVQPVAHLEGESGRPVYAYPVIDMAGDTSRARMTQSRADARYGALQIVRSDLRSRTAQLSVDLAPRLPRESFSWSTSYTLSRTFSGARGFDGTTAGDPRAIEWGRADLDVRHQIAISVVTRFRNSVHLILYERLRSGLAFTPLVGADINGDGWLNDRAFIPTAGQYGDSAFATQFERLLASAPNRTRQCLQSHAGAIAARNACTGPWSSQLNVQVGLNASQMGISDRVFVSLGISNALGGLDHLIHGNDWHGWGTAAPVDPVLLYPRAADSTRPGFAYVVNPRFGGADRAASRVVEPARLTLEARVALGPVPVTSAISSLIGISSRSRVPQSADEIRRRLVSALINPAANVLAVRDSLGLSESQVRELERARSAFTSAATESMRLLAETLSHAPPEFADDAIARRLEQAQLRAFEVLQTQGPAVRRILSAEQVRRLPPVLQIAIDEQRVYLLRPRIGAGFGRVMFAPRR